MSKYLRTNDIDSDDDSSESEEETTKQEIVIIDQPVQPSAPNKAPKKGKDAPKKESKTNQCHLCSESFSRASSLVRHIQELRCQVKRSSSIKREQEMTAREQRLKDLENDLSNRILKSQEKEKKPRKKRVAKPKEVIKEQSITEPVIHQPKPQQPQKRYPIINF
jgi:hypothetical protein